MTEEMSKVLGYCHVYYNITGHEVVLISQTVYIYRSISIF